ncbi:lysosomal acid glucosylceramidase-like [Mercenaria mercenaria]|uniref:lysosomal acid glucosylceramidase-like n=1 Tax=Mercenaria mercenaria TaxID=6596 RepID=UPI00234F6B78|nr:lysosomal acid glucosylceramidase-like [Mercenaria mercenaria]
MKCSMKMGAYNFLLCLTLTSFGVAFDSPCVPRSFGQDSIVCVCNATYCDTFENKEPKQPGPANPIPYFDAVVTTRDGLRMVRRSGSFGAPPSEENVFKVGTTTGQTIIGFGGAFTDAATITMNSLSKAARSNLLSTYFSSAGNEYNIGRIPMASCDFSKRIYSYDDTEGDLTLSNFTLVDEDVLYKIPAIKDAMSFSKRNISLFGSPWSSPYWMKTNNNMTGKGTIKGEPGGPYFKAWANYFVKFLQAYKSHGIDIWGLTAQNEPFDGMITGFSFQCLGWTPELQRDFIAKDLGPALEKNGFGHVKLMILDDQRIFLPLWPEVVLKDPNAAKYISGIAIHWYADLFIPTSALDLTYQKFGQDYFILNTEACEQDLVNKNKSVLLGNWYRGEHYFYDIMQDLRHGVTGWVDWNMALNMQGGPNWENNRADSPIIVNAAKDEFYKQPMFYAMGHFSKFVEPGMKLLHHEANVTEDSGVEALFFIRDNRFVTANFVNINELGLNITVSDPLTAGNNFKFEIPPKSFVTFRWWRY